MGQSHSQTWNANPSENKTRNGDATVRERRDVSKLGVSKSKLLYQLFQHTFEGKKY